MEKSNTELKTYTEEKLVRKQRFQTTSLKLQASESYGS